MNNGNHHALFTPVGRRQLTNFPDSNVLVAAKSAGLRYVTDSIPGIRRRGPAKAFRYLGPQGKLIRDPATLGRIRSLAIPPAWSEVWICPFEEGHLQAVGRDARNRKQYRYHPRWREIRDSTKFDRMADFGKALPKIRARVKRDLRLAGLPKQKVLATIVRLLETTLIRVGNQEYTRQNQSFGLTTLRDHHVRIAGPTMYFYFRGKSGRKHAISVEDAHLAKIVKRCRDVPGYELFQYIDETGERHAVSSTDVNEYLRETAGDDFTAKDFRTWAGTTLAVEAFGRRPAFKTQKEGKRRIAEVLDEVAQKLGNTVAVCRKCYVHPGVFESYVRHTLTRPAAERDFARMIREWSKPKQRLTLTQALKESVKQHKHSRRTFPAFPRRGARAIKR
ncbi:MAG TPA: DNA topoisomerase IB [Terriglobia bacterium]|jgi:DNA topoisomerase-1